LNQIRFNMTKEEPPTNSTDPISPPPGTSQQVRRPVHRLHCKPQLTTSHQTPDAQGELTAAVDDLLDQLKHKVDVVSGEMFSKRAFRPSVLQLEV
jgi:hypothetical protein